MLLNATVGVSTGTKKLLEPRNKKVTTGNGAVGQESTRWIKHAVLTMVAGS